MQQIEIYGFSGKIASGKNYIAEKIFLPKLPQKKTLIISFADHMKIQIMAQYNISYERLFHKKDDETRRLLQLTGTENGRNIYGEDYWIKIIYGWMQMHAERGIERFIITDCRFPNEANFIQKNGGKIIRIESPNRTKDTIEREAMNDQEKIKQIYNHASETALDNYDNFDFILKNDYEDENKINGQIGDMIKKFNL